jgi:hypothetical protein
MSRPKLPAFTVRATQEQAERWQAAAEYDGARNVGTWLATLATERLRQLGRSVPRIVLRWRRARFHVMRRPEMGDELQPHEVAGIVAGPFGIHKDGSFCLVHVPTGCKLISLPKMARCKSLARELAPYEINWNATVPEEVTGPDVDRLAVELATVRRAVDPNAYHHT